MCESSESCFKSAFSRFISTRVSEDLAEVFVGNKEYILLSSKIETCIDELNSLILEEHSELLEKYIDANGLRELLVNELLYLQGLKGLGLQGREKGHRGGRIRSFGCIAHAALIWRFESGNICN